MLNVDDELISPFEGYVFNPSEEELITYYLKPWLDGFDLPYDRVVVRQVYGDNTTPWNIFPDNDPIWNDFFDEEDNQKKKTVFVISKVIPVGKSRVSRIAGCGTWDGKTPAQQVKDSSMGKIIGQKRQFTFKASKDFDLEPKGKGKWIMHELSLPQEYFNNNSKEDKKNYVICRITRDQYSSSGVQQEFRLLDQHLSLSGNKRKLDEDQDQDDEGTISSKKACNDDNNQVYYNEEEVQPQQQQEEEGSNNYAADTELYFSVDSNNQVVWDL